MPAEELLAGLLVAAEDEGRIFLGEPPERLAHLLLVSLGLRRDREAHDGLRKPEIGQLDLGVVRQEEVAGMRLLELGDGSDVAGSE